MLQQTPTDTLQTPTRKSLLLQLERANRWASALLFVQALLVAVLILLIDWGNIIQQPTVSTVALLVVVGPFGNEMLRFWLQKKKEIGDLKEQTRFGVFDKHRLRSLFNDTLKRLQLPDDRLPVYVIADKAMNAWALHVGLGGLFKRLNGIYLHRQALHKLGPEEVQDLMGHELGHYYRHYLVAERYRSVTLLLGGLLGLIVVDKLGMDGFINAIALMICGTGFWSLSNWPRARNAQAIEFLCDDLGAQVHGVAVSISGLMKLGADSELMMAIQQQAYFSARKGNLLAHEVVEAVMDAVPYGHVTKEELNAAVEKSIKQRVEQGPSLAGFARYVWRSDLDAEADEAYEAELKKLKMLQRVPRLDWESLLPDPLNIEFSGRRLEQLIELIEQNPNAELFRSLDVLSKAGDSHPPTKLRILYLWRNRREIETSSPSANSLGRRLEFATYGS